MNADLLQRLIDAGTPSALVAEVALEIARAEAVAAAPSQPSAGALRTRRWREARHQASPSVTCASPVTMVTGCDDGDGGDAADPAPNKRPLNPKINPTPHTGGAPAHEGTHEAAIPGHRLPVLPVLVAWAYWASLVDSQRPAKEARRATTLPDGFTPKLVGDAAQIVAAWPPGMFERELAQWRDHHASRGTTAKDWQASLRTWIRNAEKFRTERNERTSRPARTDRPSGWAPRPGVAGLEPASLDD